MEVLGCVAVLRGVAAADVTACEAGAEMDPVIAQGDAFLANVSCWWGVSGSGKMLACWHVLHLKPQLRSICNEVDVSKFGAYEIGAAILEKLLICS